MVLECNISVRKHMHSDFLTVFSDFLGPFNEQIRLLAGALFHDTQNGALRYD
jgi:hypothetical protein